MWSSDLRIKVQIDGRLPELFISRVEGLNSLYIARRSVLARKCPPSFFFIIIFSSFLHRERKVYRIKSSCERKPVLVVTIRIYSVCARSSFARPGPSINSCWSGSTRFAFDLFRTWLSTAPCCQHWSESTLLPRIDPVNVGIAQPVLIRVYAIVSGLFECQSGMHNRY